MDGHRVGDGVVPPFLTGPLETFTVGGLAAELLTPVHPNGHLVVYHLGSSETEASWRTSSDKATIRAALSAAGYMVASVDAEYNWGNQTAVNAYAALIAAVEALTSVDKVLHVAQSMGGLASLVGISQGAFQADGWAGIFPACSLAQPYAGSFTAVIKTAYGIASDGSDYASKTAGHDPVLMSGSLFTLPMRFYASTADTVIPKASHTDVMAALVAATTPESTVVACSGDHGDPSHFQPTDLVDFLGRCVA